MLLDIADSVSMSSDDDGARGKKKSNRGDGREEEDMEVGEDATTLQQKGEDIIIQAFTCILAFIS